jgi:hypothetical protein
LREVVRLLNQRSSAARAEAHLVTVPELSRMERGLDPFTPEAAATYDRLFQKGKAGW